MKPQVAVDLPVGLNDRRQYDVQVVAFDFETDRGIVKASADFLAMPRHAVSPNSIAIHAVNGVDAEPVEVVHREVRPEDEGESQALLYPPSEFKLEKVDTKSGRVLNATGFVYTDTTYVLTLLDESLGTKRADLTLKMPDGRRVFDVPMVWDRRAYLSTVPEQVILGGRPVRVFLRCPDEDVELTKILSAPAGITAVVSSPREISVRSSDDAPSSIDGVIEVETSAKGQPPLRVPVSRVDAVASRS